MSKLSTFPTFPLTHAQKRMWYTEAIFPDTSLSNVAVKVTFDEIINTSILEKSLQALVYSQETLRVQLSNRETSEPVQYVVEYQPFNVRTVNKENANLTEIDNWLDEEILKPFKLYDTPLFEFTIVKMEKEHILLFIKFHHIIIDGISCALAVDKIKDLYHKLSIDNLLLSELNVESLGYLNTDKEYEGSKRYSKDRQFWHAEFKTIPDYVKEHTGNLYSSNTKAECIHYPISNTLQLKINEFCIKNNISEYTLFTSLLFLYLNRTKGYNDIVIGTNYANRMPKEKELLGMFVSTTPFRMHIDPELDGISFINEVNKKQMRLLRHHKYPYNKLLGELRENNNDVNALFSVAIEYQELSHEVVFCGHETNEFTFHFKRDIDKTLLYVGYRLELFDESDIKHMLEHVFNLLDDLIENPHLKLNEIDICSKEEKQKLLLDFNRTEADYPKKPIHLLFEEQVEKTPENISVVYKSESLTYKELNEKANQLARTLRTYGVQPDSRVGLLMERSIDMIVGLLAILKSGGAYVPIDPEYPVERIQYILEDGEVPMVLSQASLIDRLASQVSFKGQWLDTKQTDVYHIDNSNLLTVNKHTDLAYIIYTSGTTGKPKGVMIEHQGVSNLIGHFEKTLNIEDMDRIGQFASISFDAAVEEIWSALLSGAELSIIPKDVIYHYKEFENYVNKHKISKLLLPPSYMKHLNIDNMKTLKHVISGGSASSTDLLHKWGRIYRNAYGPTEATVAATIWIDNNESNKQLSIIPIGKPVSNTQIYILNESLQPQPIGVPGEMYISGVGVARGYLNRPDLTAEKFIENPFIPGTKMYRTGDLARWLSDGNIEFLGRIDHQVKIRGYRIELGEIEATLLQHQSVQDVVVVEQLNMQDENYLCAYVVMGKTKVNVSTLKRYLNKKLPQYMVPSFFIELDRIPLTSNGKVDRRELPKPTEALRTQEYVPPTTGIEKKLVEIWEEVLGIENLGVTDSFFDQGGHSLGAIRLMSELRQEFQVEVPVRVLFEGPTIQSLAQHIEEQSVVSVNSIPKVPIQAAYPTSSAQKRIYVLQQMNPELTHYNIPSGVQLDGLLNKEKFTGALQQLIQRHDSLRTSFELVEGELMQKVHGSVTFNLPYYRMTELQVQERIKEFVQPFDFNEGSLLRAELIQVEETKHIFLLDMHHIISDGISISLFLKELSQLYNGAILPNLPIQYKDFSAWQNELFQSKEIEKQKRYWLGTMQKDIPLLELPIDYNRPSIQKFVGDHITFEVDSETTEGLKTLTKQTGTTLYMVLLAAYNVLLAKYTNQTDVIVGTPVAGRTHSDVNPLIGMFVNTLAMRNYPTQDKSFVQFLNEVKANALQAYENQDYPFEELVDQLDLERDLSRNPLFDTMFGVQDFGDLAQLTMEGINVQPYDWPIAISKFDVTVMLREEASQISGVIEYRTDLFKAESMERFIQHFIQVIKEVVLAPEKLLRDIEILSHEEKNQLLIDFNQTEADYPKKPIHLLFEEQVEKTPENVAVVYESDSLTYKELNEKANQLARTLRTHGVQPDSRIGLLMERSIDMIVGLLAILKSGGAYVPIDPEYPVERIQYILDDAEVPMVLSQASLINTLEPQVDFKGQWLDMQDSNVYDEQASNLIPVTKLSDLAYVIYTSGTTGKPKGVMVEHKGIPNLINYFKRELNTSNKDRFGQFASTSFDVSVEEIWVSLLSGTCLIIIPNHIISDHNTFEIFINESKISNLLLPPTYMRYLNYENVDNLKHVIAAGSASSPELVNEWNEKYINGYGPTETTVISTTWRYEDYRKDLSLIPIGKPISNTQIYILNESLQPQPIGVPGEMYISGVGVARGYLNRPDLTAEKFIENPFIPGTKMYRTGDLARWLSDGNIEFLGRIDHQVKIRGYRIELGEIEAILLQHQSIQDVVVSEQLNMQGENYLCAYVVMKDTEVNVSSLKRYLNKKLPQYMIPSFFIELDCIPLTSNGKVDSRELPKPTEALRAQEYVPPTSDLEKKLVEIWEEVLGIENLGVTDSFFDQGGHSLGAIRLMSELRQELQV
ncbi:amino acid adenylation domain-containing protein, partial [Priestia megaterium]